jgi:hypothetical protein
LHLRKNKKWNGTNGTNGTSKRQYQVPKNGRLGYGKEWKAFGLGI